MTRITDTRTDALRLAQRALLIGAALVIVISTLRLFADVGRPFDGMITYHNVIIGEYFFSEATPSWWLTRRWDLIPPLEELYTVNGHPYSDAPQVFAEVWARGEDQVLIEYDDTGERLSARVPLVLFSVDQFIDLRAPTLIIAIALLLHTTSFVSPQRNSLFFCVVCAAFGFGIDQPSLFWLEDDLARALDVISMTFYSRTQFFSVAGLLLTFTLLGFLIVSRCQDMDVLYEDDMRAFSHVARELTQHLLRSRHEAHIARTNVLLHNEIMARISTIRREMQRATPQRLIDQQATWLSDLDDSLHILRDIQSARLSRERLKDLAAKVDQFDERYPHLKIEHHINDTLHLPDQVQADIVQSATEALNNAARHSKATRITLTLAYQPDLRMVRLVVQDNGTGAVPDASGSGLQAIADGVAVWRGTFTLANPHYGGTCLTIDLPYAQPVSESAEPPAPARAG